MDLGDFLGPASGAGSIVETITTVATSVGPYVLALFGAVLIIKVGMALVGRAQRALVTAFK